MLDVVQELLCVLGDDGTFTWAGPAWGRELGLDPDALRGQHLCDLAHPDDRERLALELLSTRGRSRVTSGFECRMLAVTGESHWVGWTSAEGTPTPRAELAVGHPSRRYHGDLIVQHAVSDWRPAPLDRSPRDCSALTRALPTHRLPTPPAIGRRPPADRPLKDRAESVDRRREFLPPPRATAHIGEAGDIQ